MELIVLIIIYTALAVLCLVFGLYLIKNTDSDEINLKKYKK